MSALIGVLYARRLIKIATHRDVTLDVRLVSDRVYLLASRRALVGASQYLQRFRRGVLDHSACHVLHKCTLRLVSGRNRWADLCFAGLEQRLPPNLDLECL